MVLSNHGLDKYGLDKHGLDKHDLDKHNLDKLGLDKHGLDKHGLDKHGLNFILKQSTSGLRLTLNLVNYGCNQIGSVRINQSINHNEKRVIAYKTFNVRGLNAS